MEREWHYYADQFDARETGEHGWRKVMASDSFPPNKRESTHIAGERCHKLCRDGLWPIPAELVTANPPEGDSPCGYMRGEFAESWYVTESGRVFKLIRHHGNSHNLVVEIAYREHQPYSWIPNYPKGTVWDWVGIQSR